jgi:hypothetical protein
MVSFATSQQFESSPRQYVNESRTLFQLNYKNSLNLVHLPTPVTDNLVISATVFMFDETLFMSSGSFPLLIVLA